MKTNINYYEDDNNSFYESYEFGKQIINVPVNAVKKTYNAISNNKGKAGLGIGLAAGAIGATAIHRFRDKQFTCKDVSDPYHKNKCLIGIMDQMIENLKRQMNKCDTSGDPSECKLELYNKIQRLLDKKYVLTKKIQDLGVIKSNKDEE